MFPTLGHLINYIFGTNILFPMPTYGFVLVMAFLTGGLVIRQAFIYREKNGDIGPKKDKRLVSGPINYSDYLLGVVFNFIVGYKIGGIITQYDLFTKGVDSYIFSTLGSLWIGLLVAGLTAAYSYYQAKQKYSPEKVYEEMDVYPHSLWLNIMVVAAFSGIIGAKLFDILENLDSFFQDPLAQLFSSGGFTFYGGLIIGVLGVFMFARKQKINILILMDAAAPAILVAYAVGRMACMLSGDGCWGIPNPEPKPEMLAFLPDWMWAYDFPHNVIKEGVPIPTCHGDYCYMLDVPVFPTPFYESSLSLLFAIIVWNLKGVVKAGGVLFFLMLIMNGITRFFIEKIRVNNTYELGSYHITQAEIISSLLVIGGVIGIYFMNRIYQNNNARKYL
ncbi:MAG: prolipoprotein diacylglyceryl transferase [Bacteroidales bacterium]|nr:prolipoprotein diacylglyceryl transferase [Bacteroidales bacterium]